MTKEQTAACLAATVTACYYGATRRSRLTWVLRQHGVTMSMANDFIGEALRAKLLEDHGSFGWISATPFLVGIAAQFDTLTEGMTWTE